MKLVAELMKDSGRSDRELARAMDVSQPTVTRTRSRLEKESIIKEYTMVPDFQKLGFKILAITLLAVDKNPNSKQLEETLKTFQNIIMFQEGLGLKYSHVVVSLHEDYSSYTEFERRLKQNDSWTVTDSANFLVNLHESGFLSFSALAKHLLTQTEKAN
jgi:Lrp/AsnC family transcriptional regulator for asnA, asnC and gidA